MPDRVNRSIWRDSTIALGIAPGIAPLFGAISRIAPKSRQYPAKSGAICTVREVIQRLEGDPLAMIQQAVAANVPLAERTDVAAVIIDELRRVHEGVLARYGLRPFELDAWKKVQG